MTKRARDLLFQSIIFSPSYIEYLIDSFQFRLFSLLAGLFV